MKKLQYIFEPVATLKVPIQLSCLACMILISNLQFFLRLSMILPSVFIFIVAIINFLFTKDIKEEKCSAEEATKQKKAMITTLIFTTIYFAWELTDQLTLMADWGIMKHISLITFFLYLIMGLAAIKHNEWQESILSWNPYLNEKMPELEAGDVIVGNELDIETKKKTGRKIVEYYKDRFVHTIVFGATGTGKTSQILGPMSYQDLQNKDIGVIVMDPKGDFAEQCYARAKYLKRPHVTYFNPVLPNCPRFNPLMCTDDNEPEMVENVVTAFQSLDTTSSSYFRDQNELLLRHSIKTVKRLLKNDATFNDMLILMNNINGKGEQMMAELHALKDDDPLVMKDNDQIYAYFTQSYFPGLKGAKQAPKTFSDSSAVRNQLQKLVSNPYLNHVFNPPYTSKLKQGEYLDFDRVLANGEVLCMCSAQGSLREVGRYLGYFLILSLQSSIFRRSGNENTRRGCALYIDEFQTYANDSMEDLLTQGRSYKVACIFATQNRALTNSGGDKGKRFQETIASNMRNIILFPGMNKDDAKYFSETFGTKKQVITRKSMTNRAYVPKWMGFDSARESISESEEDVPLFPPSELIYQKFGRVVVRFIDHNSIQLPVLIQIDFVDRSIDEKSKKYLERLTEDRKKRERRARITSEKINKRLNEQLRIDNIVSQRAEEQEGNEKISLDIPDLDNDSAVVKTKGKTDDEIEERVDQDIEDDEEILNIDKEF